MRAARWPGALIAFLAAIGALSLVTIPNALAAPTFPNVTVRVTILEIEDLGDDLDSLSDADFYTIVGFDDGAGSTQTVNNEDTPQTEDVEGEEHIHPNWEFPFESNPSKGSVEVSIQVKDEDGLFNGDDDTADVISGGTIKAKVDLRPCAVTIEGLAKTCGQPLTYAAGDKVVFKIDVLLPTSTPGLRMQCLQNPVWPTPGQTVTITATPLDGAANAMVAVDEIRIKYNGVQVVKVVNAPQATYSFIANSTEFWYECETENNGGAEQATTTPREVRVGDQNELAAPILYTGPSTNRVDIVILADPDSYPAFNDPTFLTHVHDVLLEQPLNAANQRRGYFANEYVLTKQSAFNVWIARTRGGNATNNAADTDCQLQAPENWDQYAFVDAGWILHSDNFRDCAVGSQKLFSSENDEPGTSVHETGHSPFGLVDEYCCDGGYMQTAERPDLYSSLANCQADAPTVPVPASNCRDIGNGWFTSDQMTDVMGGERTTFNPLDRRRWDWLTTECLTKGGC